MRQKKLLQSYFFLTLFERLFALAFKARAILAPEVGRSDAGVQDEIEIARHLPMAADQRTRVVANFANTSNANAIRVSLGHIGHFLAHLVEWLHTFGRLLAILFALGHQCSLVHIESYLA